MKTLIEIPPLVPASTDPIVRSSSDLYRSVAPVYGPMPAPSSFQSPVHEKLNGQDGDEVENEEARIERLGRERPAIFKTLWAEIFFCYSILASQFMAVSLLAPLSVIGVGHNLIYL